MQYLNSKADDKDRIMQTQARLYPGFPPPGGFATGRYSPSQYARSRHGVPNASANLFTGIDESLIQARAEAALAASMDVKVPPTMTMTMTSGGPATMFRPTDVFTTYHHPSAVCGTHLPTTSQPTPVEFPPFTDPSGVTPNFSMSAMGEATHMPSVTMTPGGFPQYAHPGIPSPFVPANSLPATSASQNRGYPAGIPVSAATGEPDTDPRELGTYTTY